MIFPTLLPFEVYPTYPKYLIQVTDIRPILIQQKWPVYMHFTTDTCIMTDNYLGGAHAGLIVASVNDRLVPPEMAVMSDIVASNDRYVIGFRLRPGVVPDDFDFTVSPIIN